MEYRSNVIPRKPLRLWPGVVAAVLLWAFRYGIPMVAPDALEYAVFSGLFFTLAIVIWWLFFSRAAWMERVGAIVLMIAASFAARALLDKSIATGMMGMMFPVFAPQTLATALVIWAVVTSRWSDGFRRVALVATILLTCAAWTMLRTNGITTQASAQFAWRWSPTAEDRLLVHANDSPVAIATPISAAVTPTEPAPALAMKKASVTKEVSVTPAWPGFRGPHRDSVIPGVRIETDWQAKPPVEMWRRAVGPGWSSFAVAGDLFYTQEQRGNDEVVSSYKLSTGAPVWRHADATRFWESNGGAGPRATPTLSSGRLYTFGATGIVNALDPRTGAVIWSHNAGKDTNTQIPEWGFSSSPLVVDDLVVIAAAGALVAYDAVSGKQRWVGQDGGISYSSPHFATIGGVPQILLLSRPGVTSVSPADGKQLWAFEMPHGTRIVQPAITAEGDVLASEDVGTGLRRISIHQGTASEQWRSIALKPYSSDFVVHAGHAFGFDGSLLSCIDLKDGKRVWKGGRYGSGQMLLLSDQDVLLVVSEEGELAVVAAAADQFKELARAKGIEGKTWNHPALAGDVLLVRNGEEMAAFRLPLLNR